MFTRIKTESEIAAIRESGRILASILKTIEQSVSSGMTGKDVSILAARELKALGGEPAFYGYMGFPDIICISVNDAVVHGIPDTTPFKDGDIVGFDFGVTYKGMITDSALSLAIGGKTTPQTAMLLKQTERSMYAGIEKVKDGVRTGDIGYAIQQVLEEYNLGIVKDLAGHGVGHKVHEDPNISNYGSNGVGPVLKAGMTIAIEPMATLGGSRVVIDQDEWTVRSLDETLTAHFEHTVLITRDGYEILTER